MTFRSSKESPEDDSYCDDIEESIEPRSRRSIKALMALPLLFIAYFGFSSTLAANININSNVGVEFGQGIQKTTACSGSTVLTLKPAATFSNTSGAGVHKFSSVTVSNIPAGCDGVDFEITAYDSTTSTPLALFNSTSTSAYVYDNAGSYSAGIWGNGLTVTTNSSSSFTATFATPVALSSSVYKITLESTAHTAVTCATGGTCSVGDTGPGGGKVFAIASGAGNGLNYEFATNPVPSGGSSYASLGNIGFQWCNVTSGTISGALGTALGTGKQNTTDMVAACSSGAANAARGYTANGYSDWFLPSYTELATFRSTLTPIMTAKGWGGTERIWTSSQGGTGNANAWFIGLDGYNNAADGKQQSYPVFPIRSWAN